MRLASLAIVATMLLAVGPAVADKTITPGDSYTDSIQVEDDVYVKPGWWKGDDDGTGGVAAQADGSHENKEELAWLWINDSSDADETAPVTIEVEANQSVVAAMDVFQIRETEGITPDCPQKLVEDIYPEANENVIFWADRVSRQTTEHHQRGTGPATMSVELYPEEAPRGWFVAIYPQGGSGHDLVETATGTAEINFEVSIASDDMQVKPGRTYTQPERPFDLEQWGLVTNPENTVDCAREGVGLPDAVSDIDETEIPGHGSTEERIVSLLDTHLE